MSSARLLFVALLALLPGFAQPAESSFAQLLAEQSIIRGQFLQTRTLPGLAQPQISSGRFIYVREKALLWRTEAPVTEEIVFAPGSASGPVDRLMLDLFDPK